MIYLRVPWPPGPLRLYPFRYVDPLTARWVRARYVAEVHEIAARYARWELTGPPELRRSTTGAFSPFSPTKRDAQD